MELQLCQRITRPTRDLPYESIETDTAFILVVYLSAEKDEIQISINDEGTEISIGTRARRSFVERVVSGSFALRRELEILQFRKTFKIPEGVALDRVRARFDEVHGIVFIYMPKLVIGCILGVEIVEVDRKDEDKAEVVEQEKEGTQESKIKPWNEEEDVDNQGVFSDEDHEEGTPPGCAISPHDVATDGQSSEEEEKDNEGVKKPKDWEEESQQERQHFPKGQMDETENIDVDSTRENDDEKLTAEKDGKEPLAKEFSPEEFSSEQVTEHESNSDGEVPPRIPDCRIISSSEDGPHENSNKDRNEESTPPKYHRNSKAEIINAECNKFPVPDWSEKNVKNGNKGNDEDGHHKKAIHECEDQMPDKLAHDIRADENADGKSPKIMESSTKQSQDNEMGMGRNGGLGSPQQEKPLPKKVLKEEEISEAAKTPVPHASQQPETMGLAMSNGEEKRMERDKQASGESSVQQREDLGGKDSKQGKTQDGIPKAAKIQSPQQIDFEEPKERHQAKAPKEGNKQKRKMDKHQKVDMLEDLEGKPGEIQNEGLSSPKSEEISCKLTKSEGPKAPEIPIMSKAKPDSSLQDQGRSISEDDEQEDSGVSGDDDDDDATGLSSKTTQKRQIRPPSSPFSATTMLAGAAVIMSLALICLHMLKGKKRQ